jgi:transposase InsO family protein
MDFSRAAVTQGSAYLQTGALPPALTRHQRRDFIAKWGQFVVGDTGHLLHLASSRIVVAAEDIDALLSHFFRTRTVGRDKLYAYLKDKYLGISRPRVQAFLDNQEAWQLHKRVNTMTVVAPITAKRPYERVQIDLIDVRNMTKGPINRHKKWILTAVDVFSKYAWAVPLPNKKGPTVADALDRLVSLQMPTTPHLVQSDNEFRTDAMAAVYRKHGITAVFSSPGRPQTQGGVERFNGVLKRFLHLHLTQYRTQNWVDVLPQILKVYNTSHHSTIALTPAEAARLQGNARADVADRIQAKAELYLRNAKRHFPVLSKGDSVRVSLKAVGQKGPFAKDSTPNWTQELFTVRTKSRPRDDLHNPVFTLEDQDGNRVQNRFYRDELLRVDRDGLMTTAMVRRLR